MSVLTTLLRQICAFIARHPERHVQLTWQFLNPIYYLTGYGSTWSTISAFSVTFFDIMQLVITYRGSKTLGPEWFRIFPGHWSLWLMLLYISASNLQEGIKGCRHFAWVAWRIFVWRWSGSEESFLFSGARIVPDIKE
ncbi:unnamed protein product [Aureobasidium uvarum]|uniref:Uncharacterized protein n=1 Tax=Aureobasidium uvarum TaxID=2773716 RepID=A0A9N8KPY0_9PEZI|nr:unnamed protein product [Aureobasidium uvarum]